MFSGDLSKLGVNGQFVADGQVYRGLNILLIVMFGVLVVLIISTYQAYRSYQALNATGVTADVTQSDINFAYNMYITDFVFSGVVFAMMALIWMYSSKLNSWMCVKNYAAQRAAPQVQGQTQQRS